MRIDSMITEANLVDVGAWDLDAYIDTLEQKLEQLEVLHRDLCVHDPKGREQANKTILAYYDMKAMFIKELGFKIPGMPGAPGRNENFRVVVLVEEIKK